MPRVICPGLPASWINAWLAAVGTTVLDSRIRLHWTTDGSPCAVISCGKVDPIEAIIESWPDMEMLSDMPIAEHWRDAGVLQRKVPVTEFASRAQVARRHSHSWSLSSTMTDLHIDKNGEVAHAPFDPAGPGSIKWLHHRVQKVHQQVDSPYTDVRRSLMGQSVRVRDNGLGFDQTRLGSLADKTERWVDPIVEVLAFFGLAILPIRGHGTDERLSRSSLSRTAVQKGWRRLGKTRVRNPRRFYWPAWNQELDKDGIDALLDIWDPAKSSSWQLLGIHTAWKSVTFKGRGSGDKTRAIGSERL